MCARYDLHHKRSLLQAVLQQLRARAAGQDVSISDADLYEGDEEPLDPNYNAAPTNRMPVVVNRGGTWVMEIMELGLIPPWWDKNRPLKECRRPVNARDDGVLTKPYFQTAIIHGRCLVPMSGYYEWQKAGKGGNDRLPFYIHRRDEMPFYVAGIFAEWKSPHGPVRTFCTMTVPANDLILSIPHPRMLAILSPEEAEVWMNPETLARDAVALLRPYPGDDFTMHRVTTRVNRVSFNERACIEKVSDEEAARLPSEDRAIERRRQQLERLRQQDEENGQENLFGDYA